LSELKFKDLCSEEHNAFVREVLSCACDAKHGKEADRKNRNEIAARISTILFSEQENLVYKVVKRLKQAINAQTEESK
jgi:hypothetical protein